MKKLTTIGLAILFLLSIVVVGVFGMKNDPYRQQIYTTDLRFTQITAVHSKMDIPDVEVVKLNDTNWYARVKVTSFALISENDPLTIMPGYMIIPEDATDKSVYVSVVEGGEYVSAESNVVRVTKSVNFKLSYKRNDSPGSPIIYLQIYLKDK